MPEPTRPATYASEQHRTPPNSESVHDKDIEVANPSSNPSSLPDRNDIPFEQPGQDAEKTPGDAPPKHSGAPDGERPQRSKLKIALIMLSLGISVLLVALDITIVTTALPTISEHFHSASGYTWVGSAYLIANSAATPIWGKVSVSH